MLSLQSPMQALLTCTVPRELQEDLQELGATMYSVVWDSAL